MSKLNYTSGNVYYSVIRCSVCKGVISGPLQHSGDYLCCCYKESNTDQIPTGWICPRCHTINAPFIKKCDCDSIHYDTYNYKITY